MVVVRHSYFLDFSTGQAAPPNPDYFNKNAQRVYDVAARDNLMRHNEIYAELQEQLKLLGIRKLAFLDIGCSTAQRMSRELQATELDQYHGVDISSTSLDSARSNTASLKSRKIFTEGAFREIASHVKDNHYDLVWSSYCLHHEQDYAAKKDFLQKCRDKLNSKPGSAILLTDLKANENETLDKARERFINEAMQVWVDAFPNDPVLVNEVKRHVYDSDFPTKISEFEKMANELGLNMEILERPNQDEYFAKHYVMLKFTRKNN